MRCEGSEILFGSIHGYLRTKTSLRLIR
jgi:hypothetical protein